MGTDIAAGRYFSDPASSCYWERQSGLGGGLEDIIANEFIGFDARQWIVDIAPSDRAFKTDADCGTWFSTPKVGAQTTIPPGIWLVGSQIPAGTYRVNAGSGCYWERTRDFSGTLQGIIDNDFVGSAGPLMVEIKSSDVGFHNDGDCGTWTRVSAVEPVVEGKSERQASPDRIATNWRLHQERERAESGR